MSYYFRSIRLFFVLILKANPTVKGKHQQVKANTRKSAVNEQSPIQALQKNFVHRSAKFQTTEIQKIGSECGYGA